MYINCIGGMLMTVPILCNNCWQRFPLTADAPTIDQGVSGGIPYIRVTVQCPHCKKIVDVPRDSETEALLKDRLEAKKKEPAHFEYYHVDLSRGTSMHIRQ